MKYNNKKINNQKDIRHKNYKDNQKNIKRSIIKSVRSLCNMLPVLLGVILLISLANIIIPKTIYSLIFRNNALLDPFIGSAIGSILAGSPITSYLIGGELLKQGVTLLGVTAFLVAWVTVGIVQLPAESILLGKRFAVIRTIVSFIFAIIVAIITIIIMNIIT